MEKNLLEVKDLSVSFNTYAGEVQALRGISFSVARGETLAIVGESGSGKSVTVQTIMKLIQMPPGEIKSGQILFNGEDLITISDEKMSKLRGGKIGMIFQDFRLLPNKTVYENVAFAMEIVHKSQRKIKRQVPLALKLMGISSKANMFPDELSAGEQQRVAIARAIINKPAMLIADEPTGNLDPATAWEIMNLLDEINKRGTTIVMVTHAKDIVDKMQKRVVTIESGKIVGDCIGKYRVPDSIGIGGERR